MAEEVGLAYVRLVPSMRGFSSTVSQEMSKSSGGVGAAGESAGRSFGKRFAAGAKIASAAVLGSMALIAKQGVDIASDTAEAQSKVGQVFGKSAKDVEAFAATSAKAWGISKREALAYTSAMGSVLVASGVNEKRASKLSLTYTKLAADMASFNNTSVEEASLALQASLTGEFEMLKKYGVVINDARLEQEALAQGVKKAGATWSAAQKRQLSYAIVMRDTAKAQGDFSRTSDGLANQQKILAARTEDLKGKLGEQLLPNAIKLVNAGNSLVDTLERNGQVVKPLIIGVGSLAASVWVVNGAVKAAIATKKAWVAVSKGAAATQKALAVASSASVRGITAAAAAAGRAAMATGRWAAATAAAAVKATASMVAAAARQVAAWALLAARSMAAAARVAAAWLISMGPIGIVIAAVAGLTIVVVKNWDKIRSFITGAATAVLNFLKRNWPLLLGILTGPFGLAVVAIVKNWDKIVGAAKAVPGKIKAVFSGMASLLVNAGKDLIQGFINGVKDKIGDLTGVLTGITKMIPLKKGPPAKDRALLRPAGRMIVGGLIDGLNDGRPKLAGALQGMSEDMRKELADRVKSLRSEVQGAFRLDLTATEIDSEGKAGASLVTRMAEQAAQAERFAAVIKQLRRGGARADLIEQLVSQGPAALASAQEIAANIGLANKLASRVAKAGKNLANSEVLAREGVNLKGGKVKVSGAGLFSDSQMANLGSSSGGGGSAPAPAIYIVADSKKFKEWIRADVRKETGGDAQKYFGQR